MSPASERVPEKPARMPSKAVPTRSPDRMNLPNRLTVGRLFLTVLFVGVLSVSFPYHNTLALILFLLAAATDYFDGEIARRYSP